MRVKLIALALYWCLIRTPAHKLGAMAEPAAGDMIVHDLDHKFREQWLPRGRALCAPVARSPGPLPVKPGEEIKPSNRLVNSAFCSRGIADVKPT